MRSDSGQSLLLFVLLFGVASGLLGLALDGAHVFEEKRRAQTLADAAAIGAAFELSSARTDQELAAAALDDARLNGFRDGSDELRVERLDPENAVAVSLHRNVRMTFLSLFGAPEMSVNAHAAAAWREGESACLLALAESGPEALVVEGPGVVRVACAVEARSTDPDAVALPDGGCLSADRVDARAPADACLSPAPGEPRSAPAPATSEPPPDCAGRPEGAATDRPEGVTDFWPGCYQDVLRIEEGVNVFNPGEYVLLDGVEVLGGEVRGEGVSFLIVDGPVQLSDASVARLRGERLFDSFSSEGEATLTPADGSFLEGALHFPSRTLSWRPNTSSEPGWNAVTAERIRLVVDDDARVVEPPPAGQRRGPGGPVLIR
ncbi:MAG: hypothetical protein GC160_01180 [Acidobacteria bacterium]|nr:hypothetical protein [Acidobacteriota bacterium]